VVKNSAHTWGTRPTGGFSLVINPETGEISYGLSSGAVISIERYTQRVRTLLATKSATNFTGTLAEDHLRRLLELNPINTYAATIDRHAGSMPDIAVQTHWEQSYLIEVKTATRANNLVLKLKQLDGFADTPNCLFAFTEHNLQGMRIALKKKGWALAMSAQFRLSRVVLIDAPTITAISRSGRLTTQEYSHGRAGQFYQCLRTPQLLRIAREIGFTVVEDVEGAIFRVGSVPNILPSAQICSDFMSSTLVDFTNYSARTRRT
jgi:hypothetical protein